MTRHTEGTRAKRTMTEKEWESIRYDLVETGLFDFEARQKTLKAVRRVVERMPPDELQTLQDRVLIIFAPAPGKHGEVYPFEETRIPLNNLQDLPAGMEYSPPLEHTVMVYLSPEIESRSQKYIDSVVAHEFAHVLLHPFGDHTYGLIERGANNKIQQWGFKPTSDWLKDSELLREPE